MAVGGGGAFTGGVNRLPPVGLIDFSVGATVGEEGATVVVVVVVVVVVSGAFCSSLAQDAVKPTIATTAPPPITAATRRAIRPDFIRSPQIERTMPAAFDDNSGERNSNRMF
jgi:hypothetical protein